MDIQEKILKARAEVLPVCFDTIPEDMKVRKAWGVWRYEYQEKYLRKPPFNPINGIKASISNPYSWRYFSEAEAAYATGKWDGIGIRLTEEDGIIGIDIDKCVKDGRIDETAQWIIETLQTYPEFSPSGTGIRLFFKGKLPGKRNKEGNIEIYADKRYVTVTGQHVSGNPIHINDNQELLNTVYYQTILLPQRVREQQKAHSFFPIASPTPQASERGSKRFTRVSSRSEDEIISYMLNEASNRDILRRYFEGDESLWGEKAPHASKSNAVYRFVRHLIFWTDGDVSKVDAIFRKSKLYDEKWDRVGKQTIENALNPPS